MLVGRDAETARLDQVVAAARLGQGGALAVLGEPGMGKTSLLDTTARRAAASCRILRATGTPSESEVAFAGLSELLAPLRDLVDDLPDRQADALRSALALGPAHAGDRLAVGAAVLGLLTRYARDAPLAVLVDDLHLWDVPSLQALTFAARRVLDDPVAIVLAGRTPETDAAVTGLETLRLAGVTEESARTLTERTAGQPLTTERLAGLYRLTAGNPLALVELATDPDLPLADVPGMPATVPETVSRVFEHRIGRLPEPAQRMLMLAAVADGDLAVIQAAAPALDLTPDDLAPALDAGLVGRASSHVTFRHPLLRAAAYSRSPSERRRAAHRAVADALPPREEDRRAWHLAESVWGTDAGIADLVDAAAARAAARRGFAVASRSYERAAGLSASPPDRDLRLLRAAQNAWGAGDARRAADLLDAVEAGRPESSTLFAAHELRATVAVKTGALRPALHMLLDLAHRTDDVKQRARLLADAVYATLFLGGAATATSLADELTAVLPEIERPGSRAVPLLACGMARMLAGQDGSADLRAGVALLDDGTELGPGDQRWPWVMAAPLYLRDDSGEAVPRPSVQTMRHDATPSMLPGLLVVTARYDATTQDWSRAEADYTLALDLARETGQTSEEAAALAGRCALAARQGAVDRCRADAADALALCAETDMHFFAAWVRFALGDLALSLGDATTAITELTALEQHLDEHGMADPDPWPGPELTEALARSGDLDGAREQARRFRTACAEKGQPWALARAHRALGLVADDDDLDAEFDAALRWHDRTPDTFETARTRLAYGARLRRAGRRVDAREPLRAALDDFERLGARLWADVTARELTATGESVRRSGQGWRAELTSQELQVALLLAEGQTTRQAAETLFLSPKTVEYHLRKIYTKLDIHSREELAARLADLA
ncbi:helix-turn-helix transcriptional regulator [Isoptericola haloaureus]|uniref:AAA family ATPase n=1 Tax=Isoptericola haloaureus TaxID=1542902 RepID=A0ABU7Z788_9MICO